MAEKLDPNKTETVNAVLKPLRDFAHEGGARGVELERHFSIKASRRKQTIRRSLRRNRKAWRDPQTSCENRKPFGQQTRLATREQLIGSARHQQKTTEKRKDAPLPRLMIRPHGGPRLPKDSGNAAQGTSAAGKTASTRAKDNRSRAIRPGSSTPCPRSEGRRSGTSACVLMSERSRRGPLGIAARPLEKRCARPIPSRLVT